ncbi:MAG: nucleotide exchange factor GrpE [Bacilli bacterium]|nr:nucleotide exchange factor GrpE [Bacilli bacterium]
MSNKEKNIKKEIKEEKEVEEKNKDCECKCQSEDKKECKCENHEHKECKKDKKGFFKKDNKEVEELKNQVSVLKESLLRNQAELQNYKRRKDEEVSKILKYKDEELIKELLGILDNFERAIKMDDNDLTDEVSRFLEGFKLIYSNTINILSKFQVKEIEAEGLEFNPEYHHAVLTDHDESKPAGVVLEVLQKGYMYKDRVIRPAMVKVNE